MESNKLNCTLLIVEDDPSILAMLTDFFTDLGADVLSTSNGAEAQSLAESSHPDLILLDVVLPNQDGFSIVNSLREESNTVPVILMTERSSIDDRVLGLDSGADDYICKPFSPRELLARVKALLRRTSEPTAGSGSQLHLKDLHINPGTREVRYRETPILLTKTEFDLLAHIALKYPEVVTHTELFVEVLGYNPGVETKAVTMHIMNLRKKFRSHGVEGVEIAAVPGVGYKFALITDI